MLSKPSVLNVGERAAKAEKFGARCEPEVDIAKVSAVVRVRPRPNDQRRRAPGRLQRGEVVEGSLAEDVVPASDVQAGHFDFRLSPRYPTRCAPLRFPLGAFKTQFGDTVSRKGGVVLGGQLPVRGLRHIVDDSDQGYDGRAERRRIVGVSA